MSELIAPAVNLIALIAILAYYLRAPMKQMITQRHEGLRDELTRVRELLRGAQDQYEEFSSKLKAIGAETSALQSQTQQDANAAKARILSESQRLASNVSSDARRAAEALYSELKGQLYSEVTGKILERSEKILKERLTGDDRARIRKEFSAQVEMSQ